MKVHNCDIVGFSYLWSLTELDPFICQIPDVMRTAWLDQVSIKDSLFTSTSCVLKGYKKDDQMVEKNMCISFCTAVGEWISSKFVWIYKRSYPVYLEDTNIGKSLPHPRIHL